MISVHVSGHDLSESLKDILRLFTGRPVHLGSDGATAVLLAEGAEVRLSSTLVETSDGHLLRTVDLDTGAEREDRFPPPRSADADARLPVPIRRAVKRQVFFLLSQRTGILPPWGSLTGIRPTTVAAEYLDLGMTESEAALRLEEDYGVSSPKADLAVRVARNEARVLASFPEDDAAIYVSIPFCTSRCSYCSFPSDTYDHVRGRMPAYLDALLSETALAGEELRSAGRRATCLYVGGGSPAVLSEDQIERLLFGIRAWIPFRDGAETTFEAGRCDDLDDGKLRAMVRGGVGRLCLNPQTTDSRTLARIGRPDPGARFAELALEARRLGIPSLSMDLIAGLPGEDEPSFLRSLEDVLALCPENITVHALSRKRGAALADPPRAIGEASIPADRMVDSAHSSLGAAGYLPYYLYRQKDTVGGLENTGFARSGTECLYNVGMMSDRRTVIGIGAGATSKRFRAGCPRIERRVSPSDLGAYLRKIAADRRDPIVPA